MTCWAGWYEKGWSSPKSNEFGAWKYRAPVVSCSSPALLHHHPSDYKNAAATRRF